MPTNTAMATFENGYKADLGLDDAKALVREAILAGIFNDLGSGGSVDLMIINKEGHTQLLGYDRPNSRSSKRQYNFLRGTATVLSTSFAPLASRVTIETVTSIGMDISS